MEESSTEASIVKKYLEDLSKIPYRVQSNDKFDLEFAQQTLDE